MGWPCLYHWLKLPASMIVHDVFHVSYLKLYTDDGQTKPSPVPEMVEDEPDSRG